MESISLPKIGFLLGKYICAKLSDGGHEAALLWKDRSCLYYDKARWGLSDAVQVLTEGMATRVWLPSYICNEAVEPFRNSAIQVAFYPIDQQLVPDLTEMKIENPQTEVLVYVHHFGFSKGIEEISSFCREQKIKWIEDAAHCLSDSLQVGAFGDAVVFSPRKLLPVCGGGVLYLRSQFALEKLDLLRPVPPVVERKCFVGLLLRRLLNVLRIPYRQIKMMFRSSEDGEQQDHPTGDGEPRMGIGEMSYRQLQQYSRNDLDEIRAIRRRNYLRLEQMLRSINVGQPLFDGLPRDVCPYVFPICVDSRDAVRQQLRMKGIPAQSWPQLPVEISGNDAFTDANGLSEKMLLLPIHQDISEHQLVAIKKTMEGIGGYESTA